MITTLITLAVGGYGLWWAADKNPQIKQKLEEVLEFRSINALEVRYDQAQVMETHQRKLLKEKGSRFLDPELKFYPYLLLEVKYNHKNKTKEGILLWDLTDGEMILNTHTWEKSHGYADCVVTHVAKHEFKILQLLCQKTLDALELQEKLQVAQPILDTWLRSCIKKNLILSFGDKYRIHLENPKFAALPETLLSENLTTKSYKRAKRAPKHFSPSQIQRLAKLAFGEHFSIRKNTPIYLPVHRIVVQNADGAIRSFYFNALSGKELPASLFYE